MTFSCPEAETKPAMEVPDEQKVTPKKRKTISKKKAKQKDGGDDESDFEIKTEKIKEEAESSDEDLVVQKAAPKRKSPKASSSPLKTQAEPVSISALPAWSEQWWSERLLSVLRREQTPSQVEQQLIFVALMRALGLDARCVRSVAYMPLAKTKDFSLTPKKDEEAAGKPYPAHGNDLALDLCWAEVYSPQVS